MNRLAEEYEKRRVLTEKFDPDEIAEHDNAYWFNREGLHHRDKGRPAKIFTNGFMEWWDNGMYLGDNVF